MLNSPHDLPSKMNALVVDPCVESRSRLRLALHHEEKSGSLRFHNITASQNLSEALNLLKANPFFDLVLISSSFPVEQISAFISDSSATREDKYAFILVLKARQQDHQTVAGSVMGGVHGMLCEPYSLEGLREVAEISQKVRGENEERRTLASLPMLVGLMLQQIDAAVSRKIERGAAGAIDSKYRTIVDRIVEKLPQAGPQAYYAALEQALASAQPRILPVYKGPSEILRKKAEEEARLEAEKASSGQPKKNLRVIYRTK